MDGKETSKTKRNKTTQLKKLITKIDQSNERVQKRSVMRTCFFFYKNRQYLNLINVLWCLKCFLDSQLGDGWGVVNLCILTMHIYNYFLSFWKFCVCVCVRDKGYIIGDVRKMTIKEKKKEKKRKEKIFVSWKNNQRQFESSYTKRKRIGKLYNKLNRFGFR